MSTPSFTMIMREIWEAEQRNPGAYFNVRANTADHFRITALAQLGGRTAEASNVWSYTMMEAEQFPAAFMREKLDFMACRIFDELEPIH